MYIEIIELGRIEQGLERFNKLIELNGKVTLNDINSVSFWKGPFSLGGIENQNITDCLLKYGDYKRYYYRKMHLQKYGWTNKIDGSSISLEKIEEPESFYLNRHHRFVLSLPEPKKL